MPVNKQIGKRLKQAREYLGLSKEYAASQVGLTRANLSAIESGNACVSSDDLALFSKLYGVSVDELARGVEPIDDPIFSDSRFIDLSDEDKMGVENLIRTQKILREQERAERSKQEAD